VKLLSVCGSLRAVSSNAEVLRAAALLAPAGTDIARFDGLAALPHFNPDDEAIDLPAVRAWRAALLSAGGVLVCSPEYAHGIPGVLKNALDWVVGSGEFSGKPVAVINAAPRATHAPAQLREVLVTMDALVFGPVVVPLAGRRLDAEGIAADPALAGPLRHAIEELARMAAG
jgi:NAD(P)H-dependent FMN reductase